MRRGVRKDVARVETVEETIFAVEPPAIARDHCLGRRGRLLGHERDRAQRRSGRDRAVVERVVAAHPARRIGAELARLALVGQLAAARTVAGRPAPHILVITAPRSEEHTSELQSLMRISYAVFCLDKKKTTTH